MTYEFSNSSANVQAEFSREAWFKALDLARLYGWRPLGTQPPSIYEFLELDPVDWEGTYLTNDGQIVRTEDAMALASALENSLDDIPDFNIEKIQVASHALAANLPGWLSPSERAMIEEGLLFQTYAVLEIPPLEFFAGNEKLHLIEFINFCKLGGFQIL